MIDCADERWMAEQYNAIPQEKRADYAFITFKIKRFRVINRIYGRDVGDELLKIVLDLVTSQLRPGESVALLKVNYYNLLLRYESDSELLDRIFAIIRAVRYLEDSRFYDRVFLGLGAYPLTKESVDFFVAQYNADLCRNLSKDARARNPHVELYGITYQDPDEFFLDPQSKLQQAIETGQIQLYLQPKVDIKTGAIAGAEALVRWIDPENGMIPVTHFLPGLNECGMIRVMDLHLFDVVCCALDRWFHQYGKKVQISVNLSKTCFNYADFFVEYTDIFEKYEIPKECIQFELLESIILNNVSRVKQVVHEITSYGFTCSLDDFGSGFSSYSVLTGINLSVLKIDRSLFQDETNKNEKIVIRHIIQTCQELKILTVAEGVESPSYIKYLQELGCDFVQGFVFYMPMPLLEFEKRFVAENEQIAL